jgi:hypothetical protein
MSTEHQSTGRGGPPLIALVVAWAAVGLPLAWGVYKTVENALKLFTS